MPSLSNYHYYLACNRLRTSLDILVRSEAACPLGWFPSTILGLCFLKSKLRALAKRSSLELSTLELNRFLVWGLRNCSAALPSPGTWRRPQAFCHPHLHVLESHRGSRCLGFLWQIPRALHTRIKKALLLDCRVDTPGYCHKMRAQIAGDEGLEQDD